MMKKGLWLIVAVWIGFFAGCLLYAENSVDPKLSLYMRELTEYDFDDMGALPLYDSVISIALGQNDTLAAGRYAYEKGVCLSENYEFYKAFQAYSDVLKYVCALSPSDETMRLRKEALVQTIRMARLIGLFYFSVEKCYELLALEPEADYRLFAYSLLAINLYELENREAAEESMALADVVVASYPGLNPFYLGAYWNYKAGLLLYRAETDSAIYCLNEAIRYADSTPKSSVTQNNFRNNLAIVYMTIGEYNLAKRCFRKNFQNFEANGPKPVSMIYVLQLYKYADLCMLMNEPDSAFWYAGQVSRLADSLHFSEVGCMSKMIEAEYLYKTGHYREAYDLYVEAAVGMDSIRRSNLTEKLAMLHNNYNNQELEKRHQLLQQEVAIYALRQQKRNLFILSLGLIIVLLVVAFLWLRRRYLANRQMRLALQREMEIKDSDIDIKDEQLHILGKAMMAFNGAFSKVQCGLMDIEKASGLEEVREKVKAMIRIINSHKQEEIVVMFEDYFNQQFSCFSKRLLSEHATLTAVELQLCMFLAMDMSAKEIAAYLNKSVRTVESLIYRLRKKMEIESSVRTSDFIRRYLYEKPVPPEGGPEAEVLQ